MKKLVSLLLTVFMILPLAVFPVSSANYDYWTFYGGHFTSLTGEIWAPKPNAYEISDEGFIYWDYDETGDIYVKHPHPDNYNYSDYLTCAYSTSAVTSNCTLPLDGLTVTLTPNEFDFDLDENGRSNMISVLWTEDYVNNLASSSTSNCYCAGLYNSDKVIGGLRNIVRCGKGLCVTLSNTDPDNIGTKIATDVYITYYDGSYTDENGSKGYCWRFTASSVMPLSLDGEPYPYTAIDLTDGLTVSVRADDTLGYIININGTDYYGQYASYNPDGKAEIDLSGLCNIEKGFVTVGAVSVSETYMTEHKCSYTVEAVNGIAPLKLWDAVPDNHIHSYSCKRTQYGCVVDTIDVYTCECGDSFTEITDPYGHSYTQKSTFATCTEDGYTEKVCRSCGDSEIISTTPAKGHNYKTVGDTGIQVCSRCGDTTNPELPPPSHEHSLTESRTEPTCEVDGSITYTCGCGYTYSTVIPTTGHNYTRYSIEPTCTKGGYTEEVCDNCNDTKILGVTPALGHDYTESRVEPTCEVDGSVTYTCNCGYSYSTVIPATGHTEGRQVDTTPGNADVYCLVCGEYMYTKTVFVPHSHFDDVKEGHWFYDSVCYVNSKGYMHGMNETSFSPNTELTREQFVTILANIAGVNADEYRNEQLMSDVKPSHWFAGYVNWAVKEGYVAGVREGVFGAGQPIQRAALARLLYLYAERNGKETDILADLSEYSDFSKVQDWMREGLSWAVNHGIITSMKDNELVLAPTATATRAQCARMLTVYDSVPDKKAEAILPEIPLEYEPDPDPVDPDPVDPDPVDPDPVDPDPVDPDPVDPDPVDPAPVPEFEPLTVNTEALKEQLVGMGMKNALGDYCFEKLNTSIAYDEENDILYAHYGAGLRYYFGSDTVEILGPGNVRPLFEIYHDYELLLRYQVVVATARMTAEGIIGAPEEYKSICDDFYDDLMDMLGMLDML